MSLPQSSKAAKLVIGLFLADKKLLPEVAQRLVTRFGDLERVSPWMEFDLTQYYRDEMGAPLYRRMLAFKTLVAQDALADIKTETNRIEQQNAVDGRRRVNIDPGLVLAERFVLASGKNFGHRIYVGQGIYADLTLVYRHGRYQELPWTYPDYRRSDMLHFLEQVRRKYLDDLHQAFGSAPAAQ